jgi:hypothetical protein
MSESATLKTWLKALLGASGVSISFFEGGRSSEILSIFGATQGIVVLFRSAQVVYASEVPPAFPLP